MKHKSMWGGFISVLLSLFFVSASSASPQSGTIYLASNEDAVLKKLDTVRVRVLIEYNEPFEGTNLASDELQNQIELALQKTGLKIGKKDDLSIPVLSCEVRFMRMQERAGVKSNVFVFKSDFTLLETVRLDRDLNVAVIMSPTWQTSHYYGTQDAGHHIELSRQNVQRQLDAFCNAWLKANPKSP